LRNDIRELLRGDEVQATADVAYGCRIEKGDTSAPSRRMSGEEHLSRKYTGPRFSRRGTIATPGVIAL
jgi:hypothetical protein